MSDLVSFSRAKAWLKSTSTADDAIIAQCISATSAAVRKYLSRDPSSVARVEYYDGQGTRILFPREYPITLVTSLKIDGLSISPAATPQLVGYFLRAGRSIQVNGHQFTRGLSNIELSYTAGYVAIPDDLQQACLITLQGALKRQSIDPNVASESVPGVYSASYRGGDILIPDEAKGLLQPYRRITP